MNPLTNTRNITKLNEREVALGISEKSSWHSEYKDSAWIFVGGLSYELTEGDMICVFSQYGEIVNLNLVRDKKTGKTKGYCFICYEDQRSTVLAVDNFNGIKLCNRIIRVDHVANYRIPKDGEDVDEETKMLREEGCGPKTAIETSSTSNQELPTKLKAEKDSNTVLKNSKNTAALQLSDLNIKKERTDPQYDKYDKTTHHRKNESTDGRSKSHDSRKVDDRSETNLNKGHNKSRHSAKEYAKADDSDRSSKHRSHNNDSDSDRDRSHKRKSRKNDTDSDSGKEHTRKQRSKLKYLKQHH